MGPLNAKIVAIGASAGSLEALRTLLPILPKEDLSILVAVHRASPSDSWLEKILSRELDRPVIQAEDGASLVPGAVITAPPDRHLLLASGGKLRVTAGPRENSSRPAIDPLFRSVAVQAGTRAIGVVMTGYLNDGAAGLAAIRRCGGGALVQSPDEADYPDMPRAAIAAVPDAEVLTLAAIGARVAELLGAAEGPLVPVPRDIAAEAAIAERGGPSMELEDELGTRSNLTCPHCQGTLWEMNDDAVLRYRCHTGHAYTADTVWDEQTRRVEEALWSAMRAHRERSEVARRLGEQAKGRLKEIWARKQAEAHAQAELIRSVLVDLPQGGPSNAEQPPAA